MKKYSSMWYVLFYHIYALGVLTKNSRKNKYSLRMEMKTIVANVNLAASLVFKLWILRSTLMNFMIPKPTKE